MIECGDWDIFKDNAINICMHIWYDIVSLIPFESITNVIFIKLVIFYGMSQFPDLVWCPTVMSTNVRPLCLEFGVVFFWTWKIILSIENGKHILDIPGGYDTVS